MANKPINQKFWDGIWEEMRLYFVAGPRCKLTEYGNHKEREFLRVWSSIAQMADIVELELEHDDETNFRTVDKYKLGSIDDHELSKLNGITELRRFHASRMPFTGSGFATVTNLTHLQTISVWRVKQFDRFFDWTQNFPALVAVYVDHTPIQKPNFKNLIHNPKLRRIGFDECGLVDTSLESFSGHPGLCNLSFARDNLTGESLSFIAECPLLVKLDFVHNKLTHKGIVTIVKSTRKKEFVNLTISANEGVDDICLKEIASMTNLNELTITNTNITDNGIMQLSEMQFLRYLDVQCTKVSEKAAQELHKKIPYCYIMYSGSNDTYEEIAPEQDGYYEHFGIERE
jgi:hypothetical protein